MEVYTENIFHSNKVLRLCLQSYGMLRRDIKVRPCSRPFVHVTYGQPDATLDCSNQELTEEYS